MPKIVFLGTGTGSAIVGKQIRGSGGIVINSGNIQLHIDPGPGSLVRAKDAKINTRETTAILVSHNHINHCNDINALIDAMTLSGLDARGVLLAPVSVVDESILTDFYKGCLERVIIVDEGKKIGIEDVEIDVTPCKHSEECVGFKLTFPRFSVGYSADTAYSKRLVEAYADTDILILNVGGDPEHNLGVDNAVKLATEIKPSLLILTHFSADIKDPLQMARDVQRETRVQTIAAKDGLDINPIYYAKSSRQKKLKSY